MFAGLADMQILSIIEFPNFVFRTIKKGRKEFTRREG
jgi:hypothetical protein